MKIYFMKQEALDLLKDNLEFVYTKYYTEQDNRWLWTVCEGDPFIEYKEIPDFSLAGLDSGGSAGEIELENCKILYKNLMFLTESQACDERLWAGLCHSVFYDYVRKRRNYHKMQPKSAKEAVSGIKSRFFFSGGSRSGMYRNTLSKCWWVGSKTYDASLENPFEKLDIIGSNDISSKISDIFYSNNFSSNPVILDGIVEAFKYFKNQDITLLMREHIRPAMQFLNAVGGSVVLDCLSEKEIADLMINYINGIIQGEEQGIESNHSAIEYENIDEMSEEIVDLLMEKNDEVMKVENEINEFENKTERVTVGNRVFVNVLETSEEKEIRVDFINGGKLFPPLAKKMLGATIGDTVEFGDKTYQIKKIE